LIVVIREPRAAQGRKKKNQRYGGLVKIVAESTGRSSQTIYAVLGGRIRSRPVQDAIDSYYRTIADCNGNAE